MTEPLRGTRGHGDREGTRTHPVAFDSRQAGGPGEATSALRAAERGQLGTGKGQQWLCRGATGATLTWGPGGPRSPDFPGLPVSPCGENGIFVGLGTQKCRFLSLLSPTSAAATAAECHECHSRRHQVCQEVLEVPGDPWDPKRDKEVAVSGTGGWQCRDLGSFGDIWGHSQQRRARRALRGCLGILGDPAGTR